VKGEDCAGVGTRRKSHRPPHAQREKPVTSRPSPGDDLQTECPSDAVDDRVPDADGRPVVARSTAANLLQHLLTPLEVHPEQVRPEEMATGSVRVGVVLELMPGPVERKRQLREPFNASTHAEKRRGRTGGRQARGNPLRDVWVRTIVERERNLRPVPWAMPEDSSED
jgi:hypothetical protein